MVESCADVWLLLRVIFQRQTAARDAPRLRRLLALDTIQTLTFDGGQRSSKRKDHAGKSYSDRLLTLIRLSPRSSV